MNMLMRLQEAASYSSPHSGDSDSASIDAHSLDSAPTTTSVTAAHTTPGSNMESTL